ncbi:MAG: hypothetical protein IPG54_07345 [Sphingomonadales bacterium]|nr:hypothetical protein [Sphingomonadales bacterium]MBK9002403.1 hypothetical protein [Sphingomonadales bacterium]MBK9267633.1 hypothetical protein [Sphingomonadales bacterium]MBP6435007.1 hypothetical protein [Sphingorhabdus sp.]
MSPRPEYRSYQFAGHDENALCLGMGASRRILIIPPLFDEMNRCRRMLVQAMRGLADRGVGALLIDLPGCNESPAALADQSLSTWREAVTAAAAQLEATHIAALRGGALVDDGAPHLPHWRLAPAKGSSLLKTMIRTRIAGDKEAGKTTSEAGLIEAARDGPVELAGNVLGPAMVAELATAAPDEIAPVTVRVLGQDIAGSPLWLRAEPQDDPAMSAALADDLDRWSASCGG